MNKPLQKVLFIIKHNFHYTHLLQLPVYQPAYYPFTIIHTEFLKNDRAQWYHAASPTHRVNKMLMYQFLKNQVLVLTLGVELSSSTLSLTKPPDFGSYFFLVSKVQPNSAFTVVLHEKQYFFCTFPMTTLFSYMLLLAGAVGMA